MLTYTTTTPEQFEYIMTTPIWQSRLMFNASLLYRKSLTDLTEQELFEVRKYSIK